ncbi:MAG: alpha/beta hydrolase fold domain-containing protein [Limisphaerales bacterium]
MKSLGLAFVLGFLLLHTAAFAQTNDTQATLIEDVIYGRKFGTALTMDVIKPAQPNGYGAIWIVSGGWFSAKFPLNDKNPWVRPMLDKGYTMFVVVHGSQPKFTIPEITEDMHRAVRYIRHHASTYGINPDKIGVSGGSAGGHLSLTLGTQGGPGKADAKDPVDRESSAVQAVACFFPPTDFLNYGKPGEDAVGVGILKDFKAAFGAKADTAEGRQELGKQISPIYFVTSNLPPTLIVHGDQDKLVPMQQAESFLERAKEAGVTTELIVRKGQGHGWPNVQPDIEAFVAWFDKHLRGK